MESIRKFWMNESGSEAAEYTIITGAVAVVVLAVLVIFGGTLYNKLYGWNNTVDGMSTPAAPTGGE